MMVPPRNRKWFSVSILYGVVSIHIVIHHKATDPIMTTAYQSSSSLVVDGFKVPVVQIFHHHRPSPRRQSHLFVLDASESSGRSINESTSSPSSKPFGTELQVPLFLSTLFSTVQLVTCSLLVAVLFIVWEDISNVHPMRSYYYLQTTSIQKQQPQRQQPSTIHLGSTVRGLAFGNRERQQIMMDGMESVEPESTLSNIRSYNEVMLDHRTRRVTKWKNQEQITRQDVEQSVRRIQLALIHILQCEQFVNEYNWEEVTKSLRDPILQVDFDEACDILNRATEYLPFEARSEVGFDFGSCAWRHCGAFADVREAIDELDHLVGILEPFEANFVLDVAERGLRDMLAVTKPYQDKSISIPEYQLLQRRSDEQEDVESFDVDFLEALEFIKKLEKTESQ